MVADRMKRTCRMEFPPIILLLETIRSIPTRFMPGAFAIHFASRLIEMTTPACNSSSSFYPFFVSATAETLFESTYKVKGPGNYGWAIKEGTRCITRSQPLIPPYTVNCSADSDCPSGPQITTCGSYGFCTCPNVDPILGGPIHDPIIEYVNLAANEYNESAALVGEGLIDEGLGRASIGGFLYRGLCNSLVEWQVCSRRFCSRFVGWPDFRCPRANRCR